MHFANLMVTIGIAAQAVFIGLMVRRRTFRSLPVFFFYIVWGVSGDSVVLLLDTLKRSNGVLPYEIESFVDLSFQYLVLIELAWSVLRPLKLSRPKVFLVGTTLVIAAGIILTWHMTAIDMGPQYAHGVVLAVHAQRSFAVLRILFFLVISCCSHVLAIGWRDRELQIATGLGFYSLVNLAGMVVLAHRSSIGQYFYVDEAVASSYLLCLGYWIYSFAHAEAPRREVTPEMQQFVLGMSDAVRKQLGRLSDNASLC